MEMECEYPPCEACSGTFDHLPGCSIQLEYEEEMKRREQECERAGRHLELECGSAFGPDAGFECMECHHCGFYNQIVHY